jgi:release factor glutamine methyltransferase
MEDYRKLEEVYRQLLEEDLKIKKKEEHEIEGVKFVIYPEVFSPRKFESTLFLIKHLDVPDGSYVWEIGCGTGIVSIFISKKARKVVATDISPVAIQNTLENVKRHGLNQKIDVRHGNLFEPVKEEKFDRIFWNFPMGYTEKEITSLPERQFFDQNYSTLRKFIEGLKDYLNPGGAAYITFSANGSRWDLLNLFCGENNVKYEVIAKKDFDRNGWILQVQLVKLFL